jgi:hypothetical protein
MSQQNLRKSETQCEVILTQPYERLVIDYNSECCRVTSHDNYIKAECFSPKGNSKFRVRIEIESVADDEVSRPQEEIKQEWKGGFQYDRNCAMCQSMLQHDKHFYTTLSNDDYATCQHVWTTSNDGHTICRKCKNIKLTRKANASSYESKSG